MPITFASKKSKNKTFAANINQVFYVSSETSELFKTKIWARIRLGLPNMCKSRRSRWKTGYWALAGERKETLFCIDNWVCRTFGIQEQKFAKSDLHFPLVLSTSALYFHTHDSQDPISPFSAKWWQGKKKTQSCPESIQTFHPAPKILPHSALMLSHPAESLLHHIFSFSAPCESNTAPPQWQRNPVMVHSSGQVGVKGCRGKVAGFNFCDCQFLYITIHHLVPAGWAAPNKSAGHHLAFFFKIWHASDLLNGLNTVYLK